MLNFLWDCFFGAKWNKSRPDWINETLNKIDQFLIDNSDGREKILYLSWQKRYISIITWQQVCS